MIGVLLMGLGVVGVLYAEPWSFLDVVSVVVGVVGCLLFLRESMAEGRS